MEVLSGFFEGREKRFQLSCFEPGVFADDGLDLRRLDTAWLAGVLDHAKCHMVQKHFV